MLDFGTVDICLYDLFDIFFLYELYSLDKALFESD